MTHDLKPNLRTSFIAIFSSILGISGLIIAILATLGFLLLSQQVLNQHTTEFDTTILQYFLSIQNQILTQFFIVISFLGKPSLLLLINLMFSIFIWLKKQKFIAIIFLIIGNGAAGFNLFLKSSLARDRPELWDRIIEVKYLSFPSGHAMGSIVIYGLIGYYLMNQFKPWRWLILTLTSILILLIGLSRLYLGVHWPTDVIAGYIMGSIWLTIAILIIEIIKYSPVIQSDKIDNQ
ncbi:MAG: phosphatase PAP2 family protein [Microcoleaceae cyanobacterium]